MLEFEIFPLSVNKLYVNIPGQGRRFLSKEGKEFKKAIDTTVKNIVGTSTNILSAFVDKRLEMEIKIESPSWVLKDGKTTRRKDLDNCSKAILDSIFASFNDLGVALDDSQIWKQQLTKVVAESDKTTVIIRLLEETL